MLCALPADFPAAVIGMQHLGRYGGALAEILAMRSTLPVSTARRQRTRARERETHP